MSKRIVAPRDENGEILGFPRHPFSEIWEAYDVTELRDTIKAEGQLVPIVLLDEPRGSGRKKRVIDGNMRQRACIGAGIEPIYRMFGVGKLGENDGDNPRYFAYKEVFGRQVTGPERNAVVLKYATMAKGYNPPIGGLGEKPVSMDEAAKKGGAKKRNVERYKVVLTKGVPELQDAYKAEVVSVSDAAACAAEPPDVQRAAVAAVIAGEAPTLKAAVAAIAPRPPAAEDPKDIGRAQLALAERGALCQGGNQALQAQLVANMRKIAAAWERV
jgi:hypothetical protein